MSKPADSPSRARRLCPTRLLPLLVIRRPHLGRLWAPPPRLAALDRRSARRSLKHGRRAQCACHGPAGRRRAWAERGRRERRRRRRDVEGIQAPPCASISRTHGLSAVRAVEGFCFGLVVERAARRLDLGRPTLEPLSCEQLGCASLERPPHLLAQLWRLGTTTFELRVQPELSTRCVRADGRLGSARSPSRSPALLSPSSSSTRLVSPRVLSQQDRASRPGSLDSTRRCAPPLAATLLAKLALTLFPPSPRPQPSSRDLSSSCASTGPAVLAGSSVPRCVHSPSASSSPFELALTPLLLLQLPENLDPPADSPLVLRPPRSPRPRSSPPATAESP